MLRAVHRLSSMEPVQARTNGIDPCTSAEPSVTVHVHHPDSVLVVDDGWWGAVVATALSRRFWQGRLGDVLRTQAAVRRLREDVTVSLRSLLRHSTRTADDQATPGSRQGIPPAVYADLLRLTRQLAERREQQLTELRNERIRLQRRATFARSLAPPAAAPQMLPYSAGEAPVHGGGGGGGSVGPPPRINDARQRGAPQTVTLPTWLITELHDTVSWPDGCENVFVRLYL